MPNAYFTGDRAREQQNGARDETLSGSASMNPPENVFSGDPVQHLLSEIYSLLAEVVSLPSLDQGYLQALHRSIAAAHASENSKSPLSLLPLLSCQAAGGEPRRAVPVAAAWRAIHLAAKLLDDVADGDADKGSGTGESTPHSINSATGFFSAAGLALLQLAPVVQRVVLPSLYKTILIMSSGQHTEVAKGVHILDDYMDIISAKSGRFFALATSWGASCGTSDRRIVSLLDDFGFNVGIFIQIADDYLDWHTLSPGDQAVESAMLPVCFVRTVGTEEQKALLDRLLLQPDGSGSAQIREIASEAGAEAYMLAEMVRHKIRALAALDELDGMHEGTHHTKALREWFSRFSAFAPG